MEPEPQMKSGQALNYFVHTHQLIDSQCSIKFRAVAQLKQLLWKIKWCGIAVFGKHCTTSYFCTTSIPMLYITIDTCVWLELLKVGLHTVDNVFDELCFWIEKGHITHILPENMLREWDRNKVKKLPEILRSIDGLNRVPLEALKGTPEMFSAYRPEAVEEAVTARIARIDRILQTHSEIARETERILIDAARKNLSCLPPNHDQDSFRDTVNLITLIMYIKDERYDPCYFTTLNYKDFSEGKTLKHQLHNDLQAVFSDAKLNYVFCDDSPFGSKLFGAVLRPTLPRYSDHLKEILQKQEEEKLRARSTVSLPLSIVNPDEEYLQNIRYIDQIASKKNPTGFEKAILDQLIRSHESYRQYFFNKIGSNGVV